VKPHILLRAYMAGVVVPTVFLLFVFAVFCVVRLAYNPDLPLERVLVFPLALVPAIWGGWNMVYVALRGRRRLPLGLHGALVPAVLAPLALVASHAFGLGFPGTLAGGIAVVVPPLMAIYYLFWKYFVGFLNDLLEIA